jgi:hypothetical protein
MQYGTTLMSALGRRGPDLNAHRPRQEPGGGRRDSENRALALEDLAHPFGLTRFPVGSQNWKPMLSRQLAQLSKRPLTRRQRELEEKFFGSSGRIRTYNPSVNSRTVAATCYYRMFICQKWVQNRVQ